MAEIKWSSKTLPTLESRRLRLRALNSSDVPALFEIFSDEEVTRYWSSPPWTDESQAVELLDQVHKDIESGDHSQWGICELNEDRVIGTCTLWQIDEKNQRSEIGFALARRAWGRGVMSEALSRLFDHVFDELAWRRLEADVDPENAPCIRLLERLGFEREGYFRERWKVGDRVSDSVMLGLLSRDWQARRA